MTQSIEERFWAKVLIQDGCWLWTGAIFAKRRGYGKVYIGGKHLRAHRAAYEFAYGPIPKGEGFHGTCVLHRCDNPRCVRPAHLELGTQAQNMRQMASRGRQRTVPLRGIASSAAKVTEEDVRFIRSSNETGAAIARRLGVTPEAIYAIRAGKNWKHVQ